MTRQNPKEVQSQNARTHGCFAQLKTDYDHDDFSEIYAELESEYQPKTYMCRILLRQLCVDIVRLSRLQRFEAEALREELNPPQYQNTLGFMDLGEQFVVHEGDRAQVSDTFLKKIDPIYSRHENAVFNRILRVMEILRLVSPRP